MKPRKKPSKKIIIFGLSVVVVIAGLATGILLLKPAVLISAKSYITKTSLPKNWTYKSSQECNIQLPVPPKEAPYIQKSSQTTSYWQKEEYSNEQNGLTTSISRVVFKSPGQSESTINAQIIIYCSPNSKKDTTDSYYNRVADKIKNDPAFKGLAVQKKTTVTLWDRQVDKFTAKAQNGDTGEYYFFATKDHIYLIRSVIQSTDKSVQSAAEKIFDNLQFKSS